VAGHALRWDGLGQAVARGRVDAAVAATPDAHSAIGKRARLASFDEFGTGRRPVVLARRGPCTRGPAIRGQNRPSTADEDDGREARPTRDPSAGSSRVVA